MSIEANQRLEGDAVDLPVHPARVRPLEGRIPKRFDHFLFGTIQSGITSFVASAIASRVFLGDGTFAINLLRSWLISWVVMLPIVLLAAPGIRHLVNRITGA
jgi:hypothetical protein